MNKRETVNLLNLLNAGELDALRAVLETNLKELDTKDMLGNKFLSGIKAARPLLKKAGKTRPILQYSHVANGIQYFTDSFWAVALNEPYHTDLIENHRNHHGTYPSVEDFIPRSHGERVTVTAEMIADPWAHEHDKLKYVVLPYEATESLVFLNAAYCKMIMQIIGDNARWYTYGPHRPVLIESERGRAVIVPFRMPDHVLKKYKEDCAQAATCGA